MRLRLKAAILGAVMLAAPAAFAAGPTFSKDVAPILYRSCVECHRTGAMAPMSLVTFDDARPWARAIKTKVVKREMPPWGADPAFGKFANDVSLKQSEIDTIAAWVDAGAPEGNRAELPKAPEFTEGWSIGKPDLGLQDDRTDPGPGRRHRPVSLCHGAHQPEGRHLGPRHRAQAERPPRRPPHHQRPRRGRRQGRRSEAEAGARSESQGHRRRRRSRAGPSVPGDGRRRRAEDSRRGRHRPADALHDDRPDGHRPDRDRCRPRQGASRAGARRRRRTDPEHAARHSASRSELRGHRAADDRQGHVPDQRSTRTCTCAART